MRSDARPTVLYPGTFDPVTRGHEGIIERALTFVDTLIVGVAADTQKEPLFSLSERVAMIEEVIEDDRVTVEGFDGLTVEFARERGASIILRGLRAVSDFEYEFQMALMNKHLAPGIEIVFMAPEATYSFVTSSLVREVARLGGDVDAFVAPSVARRLSDRFGAGETA